MAVYYSHVAKVVFKLRRAYVIYSSLLGRANSLKSKAGKRHALKMQRAIHSELCRLENMPALMGIAYKGPAAKLLPRL